MLVSRDTLIGITTALLAAVFAVSCYSPRETEAEEATGRITAEGAEKPEASRVVPDPGASAASSPFLSLEEQRAADLAYKVLGVELEELTQEELRVVKAQGYPGGVRAPTPSKQTSGCSKKKLPRLNRSSCKSSFAKT